MADTVPLTLVTPLGQTFYKGHVRHPLKDHLIEVSHGKHAHRLRAMKRYIGAPPSSWDSTTQGVIGPTKDQSQCGSCWDFSGTFVVETAFYAAGLLKPDGSQALSEEYTLDCGRNGGCNGDDNVTVLQWAKSTGLPLSSVYGPYTAGGGSPGRCKYVSGMQLYQIDDWGFADGSGGNGVTPASDIKAAIMAYKGVGCAVAAGGSSFWNTGQGVDHGTSHSIDHDVGLVGWDDSKGKVTGALDPDLAYIRASQTTVWKMRNSWRDWGFDGSYAWIAEGADQIGTETVWAIKHGVTPPPWWI